jgi:hypothetical protein
MKNPFNYILSARCVERIITGAIKPASIVFLPEGRGSCAGISEDTLPKNQGSKGALTMRRTVFAFVVLFLFSTIVLAAGGDHRRKRGCDPGRACGDPKSAVVGVWTMGFCNAQSPSPPYPYGFDCTTQVVNFHEDGSVWSSYMFDQNSNPQNPFLGVSVGATGQWSYLGDHQFFVTMLRFVNDHSSGRLIGILRTDFTVIAYPKSDEAVTGKMKYLGFMAQDIGKFPGYVVTADPYEDQWNPEIDGPTGIPMKRIPSFDPDSPVLY